MAYVIIKLFVIKEKDRRKGKSQQLIIILLFIVIHLLSITLLGTIKNFATRMNG